MDYVSTRGSAPALDFAGVTLAGLASDGGLYLPRTWPRFSADEIAAMRGLPYAQLAQRVMQPFVGNCLTPERLGQLCEILRVPSDKAKDKEGRQLIHLFCKPRLGAICRALAISQRPVRFAVRLSSVRRGPRCC